MIPTFSFDLSSMALWFDSTFITQGGHAEYLSDVLNSGINGKIDEAVKIAVKDAPDDRELNRVIELLSCIWHEQKHFFDFCFTTYGAFRFRQFLEIYINLTPLLKISRDDQAELVFPMDATLDPVRKSLLNIKTSESFEKIAYAVKKRKKFSKEDRDTIEIDGLKYELGGEAQLEALAYITQLTAIQSYFGSKTSLTIQGLTPDRISSNQKYNWFIKIGQHYGILSPKKLAERQLLLNVAPLLPILYASLFNKYWGNDGNTEDYENDIPSFRFIYLIEEIFEVREEYLNKDLHGQWMLVNAICKAKWGRTVLEEIDRDIEKEEQYLQNVQGLPDVLPHVKQAFEEYHNLRKKIVSIFRKDPLQIITPEIFVRNILPSVHPMPIAAYPHGTELNLESWSRVLGFAEGENKWNWAFIPTQWGGSTNTLSLKNTSDWGSIISFCSPVAKLLINGRKHKTMLGPELLVAQKMLEAQGYILKFDPLFEFPEEKNGIAYYYYLTNKSVAICDTCKGKIESPEGHLLSPWFFRYSMRNARLALTAYGGEDIGRFKFYKDWSYWLVCKNCVNEIKKYFDWQE